MNELVLIAVLLGSFPVTSYRSVKAQTDSSPFITSIGEHVSKSGCAVSQDLLKLGIVKYGDTIYIDQIGFRRVNDTMHRRIKRQIDIWVDSYEAEKTHDQKFGGKRLKVWLIQKKT